MAGLDLPDIPATLKSLQQYLKVATTHDQRDPVVSYWCRLYSLQTGLKLSTKTSEETNFLLKLMDWLEATKKSLSDNEAITNDVAAQAHLENWALKLFLYADKNDRASNFGKNVIQSFFTAGLLYDVLTLFGELSEEAAQNRKYAKWKAAYIHNCIKNGETPIPGPAQDSDDNMYLEQNRGEDLKKSEEEEEESMPDSNIPSVINPPVSPPAISPFEAPYKPAAGGVSEPIPGSFATPTITEGGVELTLDQMNKAQKYIKWAGSALNYDDVPTAISNLQKVLYLLTTGKELA